MSAKAYNSFQKLSVQTDLFLNALMDAYGPNLEEVERDLRRDARSYYSPCMASRMRLKMAALVRATLKERRRKD